MIAFAMGETIEAVAILIVIVLNAGIGFLTKWKAEEALSARSLPRGKLLERTHERDYRQFLYWGIGLHD